jgi:hypothetical protein
MRRITLVGFLVGVIMLLAAGPAAAKSSGFVAHAGGGGSTISAETGVYFTIAGGAGGNRDFQQIEVDCSAAGTVVYGTVINVTFDASGNATSQTIFPPASNCTAMEEKPMQIGKPHILATITFTVAP